MKLPPSPVGCPLDALLRVLSGPWTIYILCRLHQNGPTRFGQLKRQLAGISSKMLTERLRTLEGAEIIYRNHAPTIPPQVTYGLTPEGIELTTVLDQLNDLAHNWQTHSETTYKNRHNSIPSLPPLLAQATPSSAIFFQASLGVPLLKKLNSLFLAFRLVIPSLPFISK